MWFAYTDQKPFLIRTLKTIMRLTGLLTIKGETIFKKCNKQCIELIVTNWQIKRATLIYSQVL